MDAAQNLLATLSDIAKPPEDAGKASGAVATFLDARHAVRLPPGYKPRSAAEMTFDPRLAFEIALQIESPEEVIERYGLTREQFLEIAANPVFQQTVQQLAAEIAEKGISFQMKARIQAEDLLTQSYAIATNAEAPASVRADLIKWTAKVAGFEPKEDKAGLGAGEKFQLQIVFQGQSGTGAQPVTIEGERV